MPAPVSEPWMARPQPAPTEPWMAAPPARKGPSAIETIAGTGPGIPDDALAPGEELPNPPTDEQVAETARKLGAPTERDTLPLDGE